MSTEHYADSGPVDFYGGPFSNFAESPIYLTSAWGHCVLYPTVEHAYQAAKASSREEHDWIREPRDCWKTKRRGNACQLRSDWEEIKYDVMLACLREKYKQPYFRDWLLWTGDREIREDSPTDFVWGYQNGGLNLLGKALMQVRDEIRRERVEYDS